MTTGVFTTPAFTPLPFTLEHDPGNLTNVPNFQKTTGYIPGTQPVIDTPRGLPAQTQSALHDLMQKVIPHVPRG